MQKIAVKKHEKGEAFEKVADVAPDNRPELMAKIEEMFTNKGVRCKTYKRQGGQIEANIYPRDYVDIVEFTNMLLDTQKITGRRGKVKLKVAHSTVSVVIVI